MFPVCDLCQPTRTLVYDKGWSPWAFLGGTDQRSWDRLMGLVERNVKEAAKSQTNSAQSQVQRMKEAAEV